MPTTNFKLFDENKTNAMTDAEYASANQRLNGVQSGIASSKLQNKFQIQMSMVAYAIAQVMVQNGYDATDSTAITTFVSNLSNSVLQKVVDKATTAQAQAGTDNTKWMTPALVKASVEKIAPMVSAILSDETKALFGLGTDAVPDEVLAELGKYKQYWWRRRTVTPITKYKLEKVLDGTTACIVAYAPSGQTNSIKILSNLSVNEDTGEFVYTAENRTWTSGSGSAPGLNRVDFINESIDPEQNPTPTWSIISPGVIYYFDTSKSVSFGSSNTELYFGANTSRYKYESTQYVSGYTYGDWEYVQSSSRSAYPDSGTSGGYEYEYLGIPLDNAVSGVKIETGSYVGTGTYGQANPNTLTFGFVPQMLVVMNADSGGVVTWASLYARGFLATREVKSVVANVYDNYTKIVFEQITWNEKTVSWYASIPSGSASDLNANCQLNENNVTYCYFAIG